MSDRRERAPDAERRWTDLLAHAKPRPRPPAEDAEDIRRAVYAEWEAVTGRRVWLKRGALGAAAALALTGAIWVGAGFDAGVPVPAIARVERVQGVVGADDAGRLAAGSGLAAGDRVSTGAGQVAFRLASGGSLRVGAGSTVVLTGADAAELIAGVLYFDSEDQRVGREFTVTTTLGTVRDIGTQFLMRLDGQSQLDVGVRDGRVALTSEGDTDSAGAGERLVATQDSGTIRRSGVATFGGEWDWAEQLAPPFDIDGRTVSEFLKWFAAQTGRRVEFESPAAERVARETVLRGSIALEPLQELAAVLSLSDLSYVLEGERVVISTR